MTRFQGFVYAAVAAGSLSFGANAEAGTVVFEFSAILPGSNPPPSSNPAPWIRAIFTQTDTDEVTLTIVNLLGGANDHIKSLYFNYDPAASGAPSISAAYPITATNFSEDGHSHSSHSGDFDIKLSFNTPGSKGLAYGAEVPVIFTAAGITPEHFKFKSTPGHPHYTSFFAMAHVGDANGGQSTWLVGDLVTTVVPIPLPSGGAMAMAGLLAVGSVRRRR